MTQKGIETQASLLVLMVDWEGGEVVAIAAPDNMAEAVEVAQTTASQTQNPEAVIYVLPAVVAYRPKRD